MEKQIFKANQFINSDVLTFARRNFTSKVDTHLHEYYELEYILSGEGEQNLNGSVYDLKAGDFYLLTPIDFHSVTAKTNMVILNISFDETIISSQWRLYFMNRREDLFFSTSGKEREYLESLFMLMENENNIVDSHTYQARKQILELLFIAIARKTATEKLAKPLNVQYSMQYIFQHFRNELSLSKIAEESGYTPHYFSMLFHKETGRRLTDFLSDLRINYAKMLLVTTDFSVTEICEKSGFGSLSNFFRLFQQKNGCTPTEYRKIKMN